MRRRQTPWHARLASACGAFSGALLLGCACLIFYEVVVRKLGHPTVWSGEVAVYLTIWATFIGLSYTEATDSHIRMSLTSDHAGPNVRFALEMLASIATAIFLVILICYGYEQAARSYDLNRISVSVLRIPMVYLHAALPVGGALALLQCLMRTLGRIEEYLKHRNAPGGATA